MAKEVKRKTGEDVFVKITKKVEHFFITYRKVILIFITAIVAGLAAFLSINYTLKQRENLAESDFGKVYLSYREIIADDDLDEDQLKEKLIGLNKSFKVVLEEHPKSKAASKSAYYIGSILFQSEEYEDAVKYFKKGRAGKSRHYSALLCLLGEASSYEQLGRYEEAEEVYRNIIKNYSDAFIVPTVLFNLGQIYEKQNKIEEAREEYSLIVSDYGWSSWAKLAEKRILLIKNT